MKYLTVEYKLLQTVQPEFPTEADMNYLIKKDIKPTLEVMLGNKARIFNVNGNQITYEIDDIVIEQFGTEAFLNPDDDGNYPVYRCNKPYMFIAENVTKVFSINEKN